MRIERAGKVEALTPRVERFLIEALGGVALDDVVAPEESKADFACLNGLVAVELKTLAGDGSERLNNLADELRRRPDWPVFLGSAPMESFIKNLDDPEPVRRKVMDRLGRAIVTHVKKANDQLAAHERMFPRKNLVRVLLLVNEDNEIYDPATVTYLVQRQLGRVEQGTLRIQNLDAVLYLSERHATMVDGLVAFPFVMIQGPQFDAVPWKESVLDFVMDAWSHWNGTALYERDQSMRFSTIDHIPEVAPRHERWRTDYRRRPYMNGFTKEELRDRFDEIIVLTKCAMTQGGPIQSGRDFTMATMSRFTHIMMEMAERAIPATEFPQERDRLLAAARRMRFPAPAFAWLERHLSARAGD